MALGTSIPADLIKRIIPVLMKQVETLSTSAEQFVNQLETIPLSTSCNDPKVKDAKKKLQDLYKQIDSIKNGLNLVNQITPVITTVSTVANTLSAAQLAIPAVPGVPTGPISKLITTFDNLGKNAKSSVSSLQGMISTINIQFARINQLLAKSIIKLSTICNSDTFNISTDIARELDELNNANVYQFPTQFYTELNVADEDITGRLIVIQNLLDQQLNVLQNLKEAPSKVQTGFLPPTNDIGDIDDYYVDVDNQIIYGPKTDTGWGNGINI